MTVATQKLVLVCVLLSCANTIHSSPKTKFSFSKTFLTSRELYEKRNEELDKCEILERSNFSSDEVDDKKESAAKPKTDAPQVVANAHIHVRFGGDFDPTPVVRTEKFIELPSHSVKDQSCPPNRNDGNAMVAQIPTNQEWFFQPPSERSGFFPQPPLAHHYYPPIFPSFNPYYYSGLYGHPYGQPPSLAPTGWQLPYQPHYHNSNPLQCASKNGNLTYGWQDDKQPCTKVDDHQSCGSTPTPRPPSNTTDASFVYFFKKDKDGNIPSSEEIRNQPTEELTDEHLRYINKFLLKDEPDGKGKKSNDERSTLQPRDSTLSTAASTSDKSTMSCSKTPQGPSPSVGCALPDVVLTKVKNRTSCKNKPRKGLNLSKNLKFEKLNLSEITNCSNPHKGMGCGSTCDMDGCPCSCIKGGLIHDMDDLLRMNGDPVADPRFANFKQWWANLFSYWNPLFVGNGLYHAPGRPF